MSGTERAQPSVPLRQFLVGVIAQPETGHLPVFRIAGIGIDLRLFETGDVIFAEALHQQADEEREGLAEQIVIVNIVLQLLLQLHEIGKTLGPGTALQQPVIAICQFHGQVRCRHGCRRLGRSG